MTVAHPVPADILRILHVEDDPHDRELARATLAADGLHCQIHHVDSRAEFERALLVDTFDLILADYSLPTFDGLTAQSIARRLAPEVPFVFLSGTLGEDLAVDRLKDGATDYVLKQRIARLPAAVRRARVEANERQERRKAEAELQRLNRQLESRIIERTSQLAHANSELGKREAKLRESEQWLQAILDHNPAVIAVKDVEGAYLLVNRRFEEITGRPRDTIVGRTDADVWPPRLADQYRANDLRVVAGKRAIEVEEPLLFPDGIHIVASTKFPLLDAGGAVCAVCGFSADITERKKMEDELRLARLEAHRASLAKSEFLSHMSHDLRTPLNAILGFAQLLESESLRPAAADGVREILHGGRHLLSLIDEVLDITRIETGHLALSLEPVLIRDVLDRTVSMIRPLAVQRGITLEVRPPVESDASVHADRQRLGQILINLLSNAVKYNRPDGTITVTVAVNPAGADGFTRIGVADTGPGIPPEKLKLLFNPFERLGAEGTAVEGTGLGLALSRSLAHAMSAQMGVRSVVNEGTTFWVDLRTATAPLPRTDTSPDRAGAAGEAPEVNADVLYVEDNPANVRLITRILERRPGIALRHAPDGATAFAMIASQLPDLILLDLHLPDLSGEEILLQLWADPITRATPKVVLTADASPGVMRRLKAAGAIACITKPLVVDEILKLVDDLLMRPTEDATDV